MKRLATLRPHTRLLLIIGAMLTLIGLFYSPDLAFFIISLVLLYQLLAPMFDRAIFNSRLLRLIVTLFIYMIVLQSVTIASWLFNSNFSLTFAPFITFVIILLLYVRPSKRLRVVTPTAFIHRYDIIALLISLAIFVPIIAHSLTRTDTHTTNTFPLLAAGNDDAAHEAMFNAHIQYDRGILYQSVGGDKVFGGDTYPAGWHSANAVIARAMYPKLSVGSESLVAYILSSLFWLLALLFVFCRVSLTLYGALYAKKPSFLSMLWLLVGLYIFGRVFVADVYPAGAYSFVPQLISILLLIPILLQLIKQYRTQASAGTLFLLVMVVIGGCLSWFLVLPALAITIVALSLLALRHSGSMAAIKSLLTIPRYCVPIYLLFAASLTQLYIMLTSHSSGSNSFVSGLLLNGGIVTYVPAFYIYSIAGLISVLTWLYVTKRPLIPTILWVIVPLIVFDVLISVVQHMYVNHNRYYFYKVLNLLTMFVIPLSIVGFAILLDVLQNKKLKIGAYSVFIALFFVALWFLLHLLLNIL